MQAAQTLLTKAGITLSKPSIVELAPYLQDFPYGSPLYASNTPRRF